MKSGHDYRGFRGVVVSKGKFLVMIRAQGENVRIGLFDALPAAVAARLSAEERYWCGAVSNE